MREGGNAVTVYICTARRLRCDAIFIDLEINSNFVRSIPYSVHTSLCPWALGESRTS